MADANELVGAMAGRLKVVGLPEKMKQELKELVEAVETKPMKGFCMVTLEDQEDSLALRCVNHSSLGASVIMLEVFKQALQEISKDPALRGLVEELYGVTINEQKKEEAGRIIRH